MECKTLNLLFIGNLFDNSRRFLYFRSLYFKLFILKLLEHIKLFLDEEEDVENIGEYKICWVSNRCRSS